MFEYQMKRNLGTVGWIVIGSVLITAELIWNDPTFTASILIGVLHTVMKTAGVLCFFECIEPKKKD